jgi:hypothetical protein
MTLLAPATFAQTAGITGTVRDQGGSALSRATIRTVHIGTNAERTVRTSHGGDYALTLLPVGIYRIEATSPNFKKGVAENIKLSVGDTVRIDFTLEVGALSETVTVKGTAPHVQSDSSALGTVIDRHQLSELPLNGRQFESLAHLVPGVVPVVQATINSSALGARSSSNNFSLDGVDNNDPYLNNFTLRPILDAIEEFKVQTLNAAELGRGAGANIQVTTRSGTNELHGSAWEFWRNDALDARNFFASPEIEKPPFNRNQFGATLGGPLFRDRTFFFLAYEGLRRRQRVISRQAVPPLAFRAGDFSALATPVRDPLTGLPFPGNVIPASRIHPAARNILAHGAYPEPTPGLSGPLNLLAANPFPNDADSISARIDHRVSRRNSLAVRYGFSRDDLLYPCSDAQAACIPGYPFTGNQHTQSLSVTDTHVLSPVLVNELRVGVNRSTAPRIALTSAAKGGRNVGGELGITGLPSSDDPNDWGFPALTIRGYGFVGDPGYVARAGITSYVADTLHRVAGAHSMRLGFEVRRLRLDAQPGRARDVLVFENRFTGHAFADFLLGYPVQTQRNPVDFVRYRSTWLLGGFIQDDFKVGSRLTLNLGLRYEYNTPDVERLDRLVNVNTFTHAYEIANQDGASRALYDPDRNNVAPRLGFAYRPRASARLVVRGGYGVFHDVGAMGNQYGPTRTGPPFFKQETFDASANPLDLTLSNPFPAGRLQPQDIFSVRGIQTDFRDGSYQQWSLGAQAEVARDTVLEVGYAGSKGSDLYRVVDVNQAILGPGTVQSRRPLPQYGSVEVLQSSGSSVYHAFLARGERRFSRGFSLLCSYTYGHAIDDGSSNLSVTIGQDAHNLAAERASADFDVRHRIVASYIWEVPFGRGRRLGAHASTLRQAVFGGWQISGITAWQTGSPLTPSLLASRSLTGPTRDRPNVTGVDPIMRDSPDRTLYLDRAAYALPPLGTFGNAGRNSVRGPGRANTDLGVAKDFHVKDKARIQLRVELFNAFNQPQLGPPVTAVDSPAFGRIGSTRANNRQVQLGLKATF